MVEELNPTQQNDPTPVPVATHSAEKTTSRFEKYQDDNLDVDSAEPEVSEVDNYLTHKFDLKKYIDEQSKNTQRSADFLIICPLYFSGNLDILRFWKDTNLFPKVKQVARCILAIPAAETTDERNFSSATQTLTPRRTTLSAESLSELLFVHKSVEAPKLYLAEK